MADYSRDEVIALCKRVEKIQFFYKEPFINRRGPRSSNKEKYSEIVAEWIIDHMDKFQQIPTNHRSNSYYTKEHDGKSNRPDAHSEKQIAIKMFNQKVIPGVGVILDYQTPLKDKNSDKFGEIDLLAFDNDERILRILELKVPNSKETMLRCVMEAYTYLKQVDHKKLIEDFNRDGKANIPENTRIVACPFIFRYNTDGAYSQQYQEYQEMLENRRPNLKTLMELLDIKPLIIEGSEGQYTARVL